MRVHVTVCTRSGVITPDIVITDTGDTPCCRPEMILFATTFCNYFFDAKSSMAVLLRHGCPSSPSKAALLALLAAAVDVSATASCPGPPPITPGGGTGAMSAVAAAQDGENGLRLTGASGVATFLIEDSPYAIVTATEDDSAQVIDLSDPTCPVVVGTAVDGESGHTTLKGARGVAVFTISGSTYAIVCGRDNDGIEVINVTNPSNLVLVGSAIDDGKGGVFPELKGAFGVSTFTIGASTFAIVVGFDNGPGCLQLIDMSNPSNPVAAGSATDGNDGFTALSGARGVATFAIGVYAYAIVASQTAGGRGGVQIVNVTNPSSPQAASAAIDEVSLWVGARLRGARDVDTFTIDDKTFAIVASFKDQGAPLHHPTHPLPIRSQSPRLP